MIEVKHLTKRYGNHTAVHDLSFTIEKGIVYGFLGPNGAGKSTTMNIITGCLGATDGEVLINGHNIVDEPTLAKKYIGYLPELPPVYMEMTPKEYLRFVMEAKGVPANKRAEQLRYAMEKTRITDVQNRLIRNLSKGYRQRVGIAQALLGDPEVIILDEPTVGLDPVQIIEIRDLIRELGASHTLILSSHILSEVQAVCDSIMIISKGRLVASDTAENLTGLFAGKVTLRLETEAGRETTAAVLNAIDEIEQYSFVEGEGENTFVEVIPTNNADIRAKLFRAFAAADIALLEISRNKASLEDVFLELTKADTTEEPATETTPEAAPENEEVSAE